MIKKLFIFGMLVFCYSVVTPSMAQLFAPAAPVLVTVDSLLTAVRTNNLSGVRELLRRSMEVNTTDPNGTSLLMIAAWEGHAVMVDFLLAQGARVQRRNNVRETALMYAALKGHLEIVKKLQARGGEINHEGWTALHYCAAEGRLEVCQYLLDQKADIDAASPNGTTPLMMAARQGHFDVVKLLLWEHADPQRKSESGQTALSMALRGGFEQAAQLIRDAGARE